MAFQLGDDESFLGSLDLTLEVEQYFFRITFAHNASWSWYILQFNLDNKAMFLAFASFNPNPPSSLDFKILL